MLSTLTLGSDIKSFCPYILKDWLVVGTLQNKQDMIVRATSKNRGRRKVESNKRSLLGGSNVDRHAAGSLGNTCSQIGYSSTTSKLRNNNLLYSGHILSSSSTRFTDFLLAHRNAALICTILTRLYWLTRFDFTGPDRTVPG
ncbi:hypothetical protein FLAG1_04775 [Fusarium langsethiae]|uniref:Uncharacterized protein n=1 Tax=Fusarium langsethiae TaxID=179993 RepID=A0A0N0V745_FUSLA|nr:hypothetical protein FLAG1_04775 [Fusarium langsethiae]